MVRAVHFRMDSGRLQLFVQTSGQATFALNAPAIWSVGAAIWSGLPLGEDRASGEPEMCSLLEGASGETEILWGWLPLSEAWLGRGVIESLEWTDP